MLAVTGVCEQPVISTALQTHVELAPTLGKHWMSFTGTQEAPTWEMKPWLSKYAFAALKGSP